MDPSKICLSSIIFFSAIHMYVCLNEYTWRKPEAYKNIIIFNKITSNRNPKTWGPIHYRGNILSDLFNLIWTPFINVFFISWSNSPIPNRGIIQGEKLIPWVLDPIMLIKHAQCRNVHKIVNIYILN